MTHQRRKNFIMKSWILLTGLLIVYSLPLTGQGAIDRYIFIGHCYQHATPGNRIDYRLEDFDFSGYKGIWLGGDVCSETMLEYATMEYLDSLLNLGNPEVHWAIGNHDARNGNWEWYEEFTGRNTFYAYSENGITRLIMNTNLVPTDCEKMDAQYEMIINTCDTVQAGNYLVLIMHHGIWKDIPGLPHPVTYAQSSLNYWNSNCYSFTSSFKESIYPKLVEAHQRGVEVYCILGDMGSTFKSIDYISDDGIRFLGCGLYFNEPDDNVLVFTHHLNEHELTYRYHNLDSLIISRTGAVER